LKTLTVSFVINDNPNPYHQPHTFRGSTCQVADGEANIKYDICICSLEKV